MENAQAAPPGIGLRNRWVQLTLGIIGMVMIANLQYGWTLFVNPIQDKFHWAKAAIQIAFTTFVFVETWLVPLEGYLIDRFGPGRITIFGGFLVGIAWSLNSVASSLPVLYLAAVIGGVGAGIVYGAMVGQALKWFPDRRGLGRDDHSDGEHDQIQRLRAHVPRVRHRARRDRRRDRILAARAAFG